MGFIYVCVWRAIRVHTVLDFFGEFPQFPSSGQCINSLNVDQAFILNLSYQLNNLNCFCINQLCMEISSIFDSEVFPKFLISFEYFQLLYLATSVYKIKVVLLWCLSMVYNIADILCLLIHCVVKSELLKLTIKADPLYFSIVMHCSCQEFRKFFNEISLHENL